MLALTGLAALGAQSSSGAGSSLQPLKSEGESDAVTKGSARRPNIVFILTDDQDVLLGTWNPTGYSHQGGSLEIMPFVRTHLAGEGASFSNMFVSTPLCVPSRAQFFSGRYYHNIDPGPTAKDDGSAVAFHTDTTSAFSKGTGMFGVLTSNGYHTAAFGKVTNNQDYVRKQTDAEMILSYIDMPADPDSYEPLAYHRHEKGVSSFETLDKNAPIFGSTYLTSQVGNRTIRWLENSSIPEYKSGGRSFFAYVGVHAPHYPATPAPWNQDKFKNVITPRTPNFNLASPHKTGHIRQNQALSARAVCWEDRHFQDRWAALLSVDDLVEGVYTSLKKAALLDQTYIFYSSDHGYTLGQWRLGSSKQHPYETDIRVPLIIRGPGIAPNENHQELVGNVDVYATILEIACGETCLPTATDGKSLSSFLISPTVADGLGIAPADKRPAVKKGWRTAILNEYKSIFNLQNDATPCWAPDEYDKECGGVMPKGPDSTSDEAQCVEEENDIGTGNCYWTDSTKTNTWRQLRIINATHNLNYVEFEKFQHFEKPTHVELYDLNKDPYQTENLLDETIFQTSEYPGAMVAALHAELARYAGCKGAGCP